MTCGVQKTQYKRASKRERERESSVCSVVVLVREGVRKKRREEKRCERGARVRGGGWETCWRLCLWVAVELEEGGICVPEVVRWAGRRQTDRQTDKSVELNADVRWRLIIRSRSSNSRCRRRRRRRNNNHNCSSSNNNNRAAAGAYSFRMASWWPTRIPLRGLHQVGFSCLLLLCPYPIPSFFSFWGNRRVVVSGYPKPVISGLIQSFNWHLVASVFTVSAYM